MTSKEKRIVFKLIAVTVLTAAAVLGMIEVKNGVNRAEAMRAMANFGEIALKYKADHGYIPPESYVETIKPELQASVRLGVLQYRARWIEAGSSKDEILAYSEKAYRSLFFHNGAVVLRLDGRVEWMDQETFARTLAAQQDPLEIEMMKK